MAKRDAPDSETIFRTQYGEAYDRFPEKMWERAVKLSGVAGGPHTTRHTFASHFLAAEPDMGLLAEVLGHTQLRVTELYAHMLPGRLARARDVVQIAPASEQWTPAVLSKVR
jgi:integrase